MDSNKHGSQLNFYATGPLKKWGE